MPETPPQTAIARQPDGRFIKGVSGNPSGREKGLISYIKSKTRDGRDLVNILHKFASGQIKATPQVRLQATVELLNRGFGRAPIQVDGDGTEGILFFEMVRLIQFGREQKHFGENAIETTPQDHPADGS